MHDIVKGGTNMIERNADGGEFTPVPAFAKTLGVERPKIDPAQVPDCDYDLACTVLFASISNALSDPRRRENYANWKRAREGSK